MTKLIDISASCHCSNIRFILAWPEDQTEIAARQCGCSFCQKHGGSWTSNRHAELAILIDNPSLVNKYAFGTKTADFYTCMRCGVVPFVLSEIENITYAVVSVRALDDISTFTVSSSATDFEGEGTGSRLERRRKNWIPTVSFKDAS